MTRILVHILAISVLALPASGQEIEYEKYELPNGLTVILHEDHSLPVVAINSWYYVGSNVSAEELAKAQAGHRTDTVDSYSNLGSILRSATTLLRNKRPFDAPALDLEASAAVSTGELNQLAQEAIPLERGVPEPTELTVNGDGL